MSAFPLLVFLASPMAAALYVRGPVMHHLSRGCRCQSSHHILRQPPSARCAVFASESEDLSAPAENGSCEPEQQQLSLGDDPSWLCSEAACEETQVFLSPIPSDDPEVACELQEGLSFGDGKPVWACGKVAPSSPLLEKRARPPLMSLLDDLLGGAKEALREVTVQHVLVESKTDAWSIYEGIKAEGASSEVVGKYAAAKSTCGSAKKRPDAKLSMLRGAPGELAFRRGAMAPQFESAAFEAEPGTLVEPFSTQFGWHVMYKVS